MPGRPVPPPLPGATPRWRPALLFGGAFALGMPPVAGLILWLLESASLLLTGDGPWFVTLSAALAAMPGAIIGHALPATAPAAFLAGACAGWWRPALWRWQSWPAIGLLAMLANAALLRALGTLPADASTLGIAGQSAPAFVAGTLLAWLCQPRAPGRHG